MFNTVRENRPGTIVAQHRNSKLKPIPRIHYPRADSWRFEKFIITPSFELVTKARWYRHRRKQIIPCKRDQREQDVCKKTVIKIYMHEIQRNSVLWILSNFLSYGKNYAWRYSVFKKSEKFINFSITLY